MGRQHWRRYVRAMLGVEVYFRPPVWAGQARVKPKAAMHDYGASKSSETLERVLSALEAQLSPQSPDLIAAVEPWIVKLLSERTQVCVTKVCGVTGCRTPGTELLKLAQKLAGSIKSCISQCIFPALLTFTGICLDRLRPASYLIKITT